MGCGNSKSGLHHVDDSVHVMLRHDKKVHQRKGGPAPAYKERAQHPLLKPLEANTAATTTSDDAANTEKEKVGGDANEAGAATAPPTTDNEPVTATEE
mmetsp:Transcript_16731/g.38628  ORF Transcript_16731/g.38628 Transcript_16731/m.38628 type:complete len:98 (-) Transcript_16731:110-403(-)|eukprot:CAMPEP_0197186724 /NCGR_PEP_ID=MMETSP1423-20130617/14462_1 /TAXON_ID=476441 /ORGANISM="Pseudo-nitzschia heimii, Strain UNC1101" /LENGTH=97 /DNA_ID=CAMNT_0042638115 /DNA_START=218 /DNA_END=511 /DNA_ORIENTATION=-